MRLFGREWGIKTLEKDGSDGTVLDTSWKDWLHAESKVFRRVTRRDTYHYYSNVAPLSDAVGKISGAISALVFRLKQEGGDMVEGHPFLNLLKRPGEGMLSGQLKRELVKSYLLTDEAWPIFRGNVSRPPLSMTYVRPYEVTIGERAADGMPDTITTESDHDRRTYKREMMGGVWRYIDRLGLNEIVPVIGDIDTTQNFRGESRLNGLLYDLDQTRSGKRHNLSNLDNGAKPSLVVTPKGTASASAALSNSWSERKVKKIASWLRNFVQGAGNASNVVVMGEAADVNTATMTNVDMDYMEMLRSNAYAIYTRYDVPIALVSAETMTLDNYTTAIKAFYTEAVTPTFARLFMPMLEVLAERDPTLRELRPTFLEHEVKALRDALISQMKELSAVDGVSVNEVRNVGGFADDPDGDVILVNASKIPLGSVNAPIEF